MIVTLISQSEKKAISRTERILDAFANRIGDSTWQTMITEEGLDSLRMQLRRTATKNTAVACHWIRSRKRSELLWIVGNRDKFNDLGYVPVNMTTKNILRDDWENDWLYLPSIKALVGLSALLHDLGKAGESFQSKLKQNKSTGDPYRHEWISVYLFCYWLKQIKKESLTDNDWLESLAHFKEHESYLQDIRIKDFSIDFSGVPPIALFVCWLIISHHKLPNLQNTLIKKERQLEICDLSSLMERINARWGYENAITSKNKSETIKLSEFKGSSVWSSLVQKWSQRLLNNIDSLNQSFNNGCWRLIALHSHLCLTLGDHYFSSLGKLPFESSCSLYANTENHNLKQHLDDHLVGVCRKALEVAHYLPQLATKMEFAHDLKKLARPSPEKFRWQDRAVKAIEAIHSNGNNKLDDDAYFIVNMASTGQGKTIANAKILRALSPNQDSLRYVLALGLRTLTLQTGNSYRKDIQLQPEDLAVLIGSETIRTLYEQNETANKEMEKVRPEYFSESASMILENNLEFTPSPTYEFLDVLFQRNEEKLKAFLYKPVLCCTIDHMMPATEAVRGGRFILPTMRLMSSDLVIDEIDDFSPNDLMAISRLVHLAGMLGRKVMISSATIPPDLAAGLFNAYQNGRTLYVKFKGKNDPTIHCMWVDEFKSDLFDITEYSSSLAMFQTMHNRYVLKRCSKLGKNVVKQLGYLIDYQLDKESDSKVQILPHYFETVKKEVYKLHSAHAEKDLETGKFVSFGLIRMANVKPCIALSRYLLNSDETDFDIKVLVYHSRELLLVRNSKELYLDKVLNRKENNPYRDLRNPLVRKHLEHSVKPNVIFLVVSTPVEEVGRDHDFDWAIIEPSSMRSIIQLAGRVRRHRTQTTNTLRPNVGVLRFNVKAALKKNPAFSHPGFEGAIDSGYALQTKDMKILIDWQNNLMPINATPRIQKASTLQPNLKLADLEHSVIADKLLNRENTGAETVHGWLKEAWFLTGLPQQLNAFREGGYSDIPLFRRLIDNEFVFSFRDENNEFHRAEKKFNLRTEKLSDFESSHLWLKINFQNELEKLLKRGWKDCENVDDILIRSPELGEILLIRSDNYKYCNVYIENLGLICGKRINYD